MTPLMLPRSIGHPETMHSLVANPSNCAFSKALSVTVYGHERLL
jgi:hypothetical protein